MLSSGTLGALFKCPEVEGGTRLSDIRTLGLIRFLGSVTTHAIPLPFSSPCGTIYCSETLPRALETYGLGLFLRHLFPRSCTFKPPCQNATGTTFQRVSSKIPDTKSRPMLGGTLAPYAKRALYRSLPSFVTGTATVQAMDLSVRTSAASPTRNFRFPRLPRQSAPKFLSRSMPNYLRHLRVPSPTPVPTPPEVQSHTSPALHQMYSIGLQTYTTPAPRHWPPG